MKKIIGFVLSKLSWIFVIKFAGLVVTFGLNLLLTKYWGGETFGKYVIATGVFALACQIAGLGTGSITLKETSKSIVDKSREYFIQYFSGVQKLLTLSSLLVATIIYMLAGELAELLSTEKMILKYIAFFIPVFTLTRNLIEAFRAYGWLNFYSYILMLGTPAGTLIFFLLDSSFVHSNNIIWPFVLSVLLLFVMAWTMFLWEAKRISLFTKSVQISEPISRILKQSLPLLFAQSSSMVLQWSDQFMLGYYSGSEEVGMYFTAIKIALLVYLPAVVLNTKVAPKLARLFEKGNINEAKNQVIRSGMEAVVFSLPIVIIIFIFAEEIMGIYDPAFVKAAWVLRIMSLGQLFNSYTASVGYCLELTGNQKKFMRIMLIGSGLNILGNFILIPLYDIIGAAISTTLTLIFVNLGFTKSVKDQFGFLPLPFFNKP